jgi:hypothetical protein
VIFGVLVESDKKMKIEHYFIVKVANQCFNAQKGQVSTCPLIM